MVEPEDDMSDTTKTLTWQLDVTFNGNRAETEDFIRALEAIVSETGLCEVYRSLYGRLRDDNEGNILITKLEAKVDDSIP